MEQLSRALHYVIGRRPFSNYSTPGILVAVVLLITAALTLQPDPARFAGLCCLLLGLLYCCHAVLGRGKRSPVSVDLWLIGVFILGFVLTLGTWFPMPVVGDSEWVVRFIEQKTVFPRWLGFTYFLGELQTSLSSAPLIGGIYGAFGMSTEIFVKGVLLSFSFGLAANLMATAHNRVGLFLALLSPLAFYFYAGQIEIYLFVSLVLLKSFESILKNEDSLTTSFWISLSALFYFGTWHILAFAGLYCLLFRKDGFWVVLCSLTLFFLGVDMMAGGVEPFLKALKAETFVGQANLVAEYAPYSSSTMFWKTEFLLTQEHLKIVGTIAMMGLLPFVCVILANRPLGSIYELMKGRGHTAFFICLGIPSVAYIFLMIPRLGIYRDFDLFTISTLSLLYGVGAILPSGWVQSMRLAYIALSLITFAMLRSL